MSKRLLTGALDGLKSRLGDILPTLSLIEQYRPPDEWFLHPSHLHGLGHTTRVFILQGLLSNLLEKDGVVINREAVRWAARTHDLRRIDDGLDIDHGVRAAQWIVDNLTATIPLEAIGAATYTVSLHNTSDELIPDMTPELSVLKDADGLDRVRLSDLEPNYLRSEYAKTLLIPIADALFRNSAGKSKYKEKPFECVVVAALRLGIIRN